MGKTSTGFRWEYDKITPSLKNGKQKAAAYLNRITRYHAMHAIAYARMNAPWTDQTGNARSGLESSTEYGTRGGVWAIEIYHKVPYGIYLETRFAGRYAIIRPTVDHEAPLYWETAREVLDAMFQGGKL